MVRTAPSKSIETKIMEDENQNQSGNSNKHSVKDYFKLGELAGYFFRKKDPNRPSNFNIKVMHGINKFSIIVFLAAVIYLILRKLL